MSYRIINPLQGTKILIEGMKQKAGKTLLGVTLILAYARKYPEVVLYGNIDVKHPNYTMKEKITQKDFEKNKEYIVFIDELDLDYPWQEAYRNEGIWTFWGRGSSHNKCALICTIQNEYAQMRNILRRTLHIIVHSTLGDPPFKVICDVIYSEYGYTGEFIQNIEIALNKYDPYLTEFKKINFNSWKTERILEKDRKNAEKSSTLKIHGNQIRALRKIVLAFLEDHDGNIAKVARRCGVSRNFVQEVRDSGA